MLQASWASSGAVSVPAMRYGLQLYRYRMCHARMRCASRLRCLRAGYAACLHRGELDGCTVHRPRAHAA